jgi:hypothetical protein
MTTANYVQYHGRVRTPTALNTDGNWVGAEDAAITLDGGTKYQFRYRVGETQDKGAPENLSLQFYHNEGYTTWTEWIIDNDPVALLGIIPRASDIYSDGDTINTQLLTSGGGTWENGSADSGDSLVAVTIDATETEVAFTVLIPRWYYVNSTLYEIADGDTIQVRLCREGNVALDSYSGGTLTITVNHPDNWLGGVFAETFLRTGIFTDSNGNKYGLQETEEVSATLRMMKGVGTVWTPQDIAGSPGKSDMEAADIVQDGDTLYIIHSGSGDDIVHHVFYMSDHATTPDEWGTVDELVYENFVLDLQCVGIAYLSTGEKFAGYMRNDGSNERVFMKVTASGVWGSEVEIDTTGSVDFYGPMLVREVDSDKVHIFYKDQTNGDIYHKSWTSGGGLSSRELVEGDAGTDPANELSMLCPVSWKDGTDEKITIVVQDDSDDYLYSVVITNDGSPETRRQVNSVATHFDGGSSRRPTACLAVDGTDVYCFFADTSTQDLWYTKSANDGSWDTPTEFLDGRTIDAISGGKITTGGSDYIGVFFDDGSDGYSGNIWYDELLLSDTVDDLIATGITANPTLDTPAIGQEHDLTPTGITANPILDTPAIGQEHDLDATGITAGPVLDTPVLTENHALNATDITADPVLDTPSLGQEHSLTATEIITTPILDTPPLGQEHSLTATEITTTPILDTPSFSESHSLTASEISATPILDTPALSEIYNLNATDITADPVLDTPTLGQEHVLTATEITANPVLDTPILTEVGEDNLIATGITANPILDTPVLGQEHDLTPTEITTTPVLDTPVITHIHDLVASEITTTPVLDTPVITHIHDLAATDIITTPALDTPVLGQEHVLSASGITANPVLGTPTLSTEGVDALDATGITTTPILDTPALGQTHVLSATYISTTPTVDTPILTVYHQLDAIEIAITPVLDAPALGQIHSLTANELSTTPVLDAPELGSIHVLTANGILTTPQMGIPGIGQIHVLNGTDILVLPILGVPPFGQIHIMTIQGILTTPVLDTPSMDVYLVEYPPDILFSAVYPTAEVNAVYPDIEINVITEV